MHNHGGLEIFQHLVAATYLIIAIQFLVAYRVTRLKSVGLRAARSLLVLSAVFVLCGMTGYVGNAWGFGQALGVGLHIVLIGTSWVFILTNQANVIIKALDDERG